MPTVSTDIGRTGVLLVNLGTPDSPGVGDVRRYLRQFLMDGRVLDIPVISRFLLVNGIIAPFRAPKSAKVYRQLWTENGSPLKYYGEVVTRQLQAQLGSLYVVRLAMRYQNPSLEAALAEMQQQQLTELVVIPFFPQYASATTGSVYEKVMAIVSRWQVMPKIRFVNRFHDHPLFLEGFVGQARRHMEAHSYDHFIFSYHGLPERQIYKGDVSGKTCALGSCCDTYRPDNQHCYRAQCFDTTRRLVKLLGIPDGKYTTSFQSRLGRTPWIQPYTDDEIKKLAAQGVTSVLAFSPSFVADCLETTIEIGDEYKELFEGLGGRHWQLVESLNDNPLWLQTLTDLVQTA